MNINEYYQTCDFALVVAISLFYPIDSTDRTDPQRVVFFFKRTPSLDLLIESYWRDELKVSPQAYFNKIKSIRTMLRNG